MENNAITSNLGRKLKKSIENAQSIDIIVSFLMKSGVKLILNELDSAIKKGVKIRILTGNYLNITQPDALYLLFEKGIDLRFYDNPRHSFHPKAYIFHCENDSEIYIGSSNLSRGALTNSIEWNYHFKKSDNTKDFSHFQDTFNDLFENRSIEITEEVLRKYSKTWVKPKFQKITKTRNIEPNGVQIEALYELKKTKEEGYDKALVVAATGTGKTYLAAFDAKDSEKILFIAHREEIIRQTRKTFENVSPEKSAGFFYGKEKERESDITFALVQSLGKKSNLEKFKRDEFDYIIIDEFHHAVANNYKNILDYFSPKFLLGLTATPERLDNRDVFALCDYNNVYEIRLKEAINKGFLSPFRYYGIYDDTVDYDEIAFRNGKYDEKDLEEKLMINKRSELVLNHYSKYNFKRTIGFCSSRKHAEYMAEYFTNKKIPAASVYSGEQGEYSENRFEAISKLEDNELKILFTVDMFNEGVDIPSVDSVLFLRPTQSPTIFLQQLGRGLRTAENKKYLTVLDFIGNYKKANLVPFLLSGYDYDTKTLLNENVLEFEYPDECFIDFDFKLIDLFKVQAAQKTRVKDRIIMEYESVKEKLEKRPTRTDLFLKMDESIYQKIIKSSQLNIFRDYLKFLDDNDELQFEEREFISTPAHEFLKTLETTGMTKSYKMPILKAFYNDGDIKMAITDDDVYKSMKEFYEYKSNGVDMLKDNSSKDYLNWGKKQYLSLAKRNPIKFLNKTHGEFFIKKKGFALALSDDLKDYIHLESFIGHFKDIIEYRTVSYYKSRYEEGIK